MTAYPDTTCRRTTTYTYRVRASGPGGDSPYSSKVTVTTPSFDDVLPTASIFPFVEAVYREKITYGSRTTPPLYCPNSSITRGEMAVFLCRAALIAPYDNPTLSFADVPKTSSQYPFIEAVYKAKITGGCATNPLRYCPTSLVTRGGDGGPAVPGVRDPPGAIATGPPRRDSGERTTAHPVRCRASLCRPAGGQRQPPIRRKRWRTGCRTALTRLGSMLEG